MCSRNELHKMLRNSKLNNYIALVSSLHKDKLELFGYKKVTPSLLKKSVQNVKSPIGIFCICNPQTHNVQNPSTIFKL